ncbi:hypothetical protein SAMN05421874_104345 [Nonomuraea maritima]|uniref:Uncharacterized protein n=1 Tax=Nonomuraea maritima TaxID=683260 RepID=A0A1G8YCM5_9ACTN|nr:hypothetical protein [Nonomuraea maritima]SDK00174.1 hypothetical protein SAMN05421874_104345 [Nonomuraea maritima]
MTTPTCPAQGANLISVPPSSTPALLTVITATVALLAGCGGASVMCGPCPGNRVQLTADQSVAAGSTYELCDGRSPCEEGAWAAPVFTVSLPGSAEDYSRVTMEAAVRDRSGREVGRGKATFPEYRPMTDEGCQCRDAWVELQVKVVG